MVCGTCLSRRGSAADRPVTARCDGGRQRLPNRADRRDCAGPSPGTIAWRDVCYGYRPACRSPADAGALPRGVVCGRCRSGMGWFV